MTDKFKSRYVLGEGYPWVNGLGPGTHYPYYEVVMNEENMTSDRIKINWPDELWENDLPKYRLVLERIDE